MQSLRQLVRLAHQIARLSFVALLFAAPSQAVPIVIDATDSGWYDDGGDHFSTNENYQVGMRGVEYRNFFVFDLSASVGETILSAQLRLANPTDITGPGFDSPDLFETFVLYDIGPTSMGTLTSGGPGGAVGQAVFADLGSGTSYGNVDITTADNGSTVVITLNGDALSALALGGVIGIGGAITTHVNDELIREFAFGWSDETSVRQLVINPIPEPGTAGLLALGLAAFSAARRRAGAAASQSL